MCYVHLHDEQLEGRKLLSAKEWTGLMQQAIDAGMVKATISGGECLTYPWFDEVFLFLKSKGITTAVLTNAVLMDYERICFFQSHRPRKIQISLYGSSDKAYEEVTGKRVFSTVIKNIIAAKEAGLPIKISITPSKYMLADIKSIIKLAKDINVPYAINIGLMTPRADTGRDKIEHDITIDDYVEIIKFNRALNNRNTEPGKADYKPEATKSDYVNGGIKCGAGRSPAADL
jgi:MoaA/NifB/PqqE/SkfB family radical SAM enzyme